VFFLHKKEVTGVGGVSAAHKRNDFSPFAVSIGLVSLMIADEELLVRMEKREKEPPNGGWALPGDFVRRGANDYLEGLDEVAARTFGEKMGRSLPRTYMTQLGAYGDERDPRGDVITVAYLAINSPAQRPLPGEDPVGERWLPIDLVLDGSLSVAFDHGLIIHDAMERTREQIETSALALAFCDPWFTIPSLRRVYEIVWDLPRDALDAGSFHKRFTNMAGLLEQVSDDDVGAARRASNGDSLPSAAGSLDGPAPRESTQAGRGRPPQLYKTGPLVWSEGSPARLERPIERPWQSWRDESAGSTGRVSTPELERPAGLPGPRVDRPPSIEQREWEAATRKAREIIWDRGRAGDDIRYGELADMLGIHRRSAAFFDLLDAVCLEEVARGGPLVTGLVVNKRTGMPGQRFFVLAGRLGRNVANLRDFADAERRSAIEWIRAHPNLGQ